MFKGWYLHWKYWEPRAVWQGSRSHVLPFLGFAESNTVATQYVRPIRPLLYPTDADAPRQRLAERCVRNAPWALRAPAGAPSTR